MLKKLIIGIVFICLGNLSFSHDYFLSITNIHFNQSTSSLEITVEMIAHDFERYYEDEFSVELLMASELEYEGTDSILFNYLNDHLMVEVNGQQKNTKWIGKEVGNDERLFCYLEITNLEQINEISVENSILTDYFEKQQNIVHLNCGEIKESCTLTKEIELCGN